MKKLYFIIPIVLVIIIVTSLILINIIPESSESYSANYSVALEAIERCNVEMVEGDKSDWCLEYHDYYRECVYGEGKLHYCMRGDGNFLINNFDLNLAEAKVLCKSFLHKGLAANCLRTLVTEPDRTKECLDYAAGDTYLQKICNLGEGETINQSMSIKEYL
jgi:hypothetical protein